MTSIVTNEQQVLKSVLEFPDRIYDLDRNEFVSPVGRDLYEVLYQLKDEEVQFTDTNIVNRGNSRNQQIDHPLLVEIRETEINLDTKSWDFYRRRLREDFAKAQIEGVLLQDLAVTSTRKGDLDAAKIRLGMNQIESFLDEVEGKSAKLKSGAELFETYREYLEKVDRGEAFYSTGDVYLDSHLTYGFSPGDMTAIFSVPGIGKTQTKLMLINKRINLRLPTLSVELEMGEVPIAERLLCNRNKISRENFHPSPSEGVNPQLYKIVEEEIRRLENIKTFRSVNKDELSINELENVIVKTKRQMRKNYMVVFIDLATMLTDFNQGAGNTAERYEKAMNKLHSLARRQNVHFVLIVQANREFEKVKMKEPKDVYKIKPNPNTVKNSAAFRERCRALIGLNRPKYFMEMYFAESPENAITENILELHILKQNGGPLGTLHYLFVPEYYELTKYEDPDMPDYTSDDAKTQTEGDSNDTSDV